MKVNLYSLIIRMKLLYSSKMFSKLYKSCCITINESLSMKESVFKIDYALVTQRTERTFTPNIIRTCSTSVNYIKIRFLINTLFILYFRLQKKHCNSKMKKIQTIKVNLVKTQCLYHALYQRCSQRFFSWNITTNQSIEH